jgi:hypothetical protein
VAQNQVGLAGVVAPVIVGAGPDEEVVQAVAIDVTSPGYARARTVVRALAHKAVVGRREVDGWRGPRAAAQNQLGLARRRAAIVEGVVVVHRVVAVAHQTRRQVKEEAQGQNGQPQTSIHDFPFGTQESAPHPSRCHRLEGDAAVEYET